MAPKNTSCWIICPDFIYPPGRSISLGNVLEDPFAPHEPLCRLHTEKWPELTKTSESEVTLTLGGSRGANASVGADLIAMVSAKISGDVKTSNSTEYTMRALRAEYFTSHPAESAILELLLPIERARDAIFSARSWLWPHRLFIITGLRIAVGFHRSSNHEASRGAGVSADPAGALLAAGAPLSANAEVGGFVQRNKGYSSTADEDIVLAYRLARISPRGWKNKQLTLAEYRLSDTGRTLGDDSGKGREGRAEIELVDAAEMDVMPADDEDDEDQGMKARIVSLEDDLCS
ncbi:hypothetical protein F5883DRAFT_551252 [Diaporthe sp. PMI_573]|nr:hypothetical protein F5883DRAFT_551252 [Diaporthaceae sp. PMI_573]